MYVKRTIPADRAIQAVKDEMKARSLDVDSAKFEITPGEFYEWNMRAMRGDDSNTPEAQRQREINDEVAHIKFCCLTGNTGELVNVTDRDGKTEIWAVLVDSEVSMTAAPVLDARNAVCAKVRAAGLTPRKKEKIYLDMPVR